MASGPHAEGSNARGSRSSNDDRDCPLLSITKAWYCASIVSSLSSTVQLNHAPSAWDDVTGDGFKVIYAGHFAGTSPIKTLDQTCRCTVATALPFAVTLGSQYSFKSLVTFSRSPEG
jgi:hypothetical protein